MKHTDSIPLHARITREADQRMVLARERLATTIAAVDKGAFVSAAINHYTDYLAAEINNGRDWLDGGQIADPELITMLSGIRLPFRPPVDWARIDTKRQPRDIELHRQLSSATMAIARLQPDPQEKRIKKAPGYRALLRRAGLEVDPTREEYEHDGHFFIPIRYRQRND